MALIKQEYENGVVYVLASGRIVRDPSYKQVGNKAVSCTTFSLSVGYSKDEDGDSKTEFLSCTCWRELADFAAGLKKGDVVFITGAIEKTEYNGKTYEKAVCDLILPQIFALDELGKTVYKAPPSDSEDDEDDIPF